MGGRGGSSHRNTGGPQSQGLPLSLQFFAQKEARDLQRLISQAGLSASDVAYLHGQLAKIIAENDPAMRVRRDYVELIIDTHFKNQMETGTSQGANAPDLRARLSADYFGHPYDRAHKVAAGEFEKYGYLAPRDKVAAMSNAGAMFYGDVIFRFKRDAIMDRTTFKTADTLNSWSGHGSAHAGWLKTASISGLSEIDRDTVRKVRAAERYIRDPDTWVSRVNYGEYFELQYHGSLSIKDVESVTFGSTLPNNFTRILDKLKRNGIKVYQVSGGRLREL